MLCASHRGKENASMMSRGLLVLLVLVLAGGLPPFQRQAVAQDADASPVPGATPQFATGAPLDWAPCADIPDTECAWLAVPIDHTRPDGPTINLRLGRVPAIDPATREGALLLIPGGPGAGVNEMLAGAWGLRAAQHVDEFAQRYDVVTFDPRGIGESNPIRCDPDLVPPVSQPQDQAPSAAEFAALAETNAAFYESCFAATGELMSHLSVQDTAGDIESIRQALGEENGLMAYGGSYGSAYGAAYLEQYGEHVKALVLDGIVDHSVDMATFMTRNVLAAQDAFDRFSQWCADDESCALHGQDVGAAFDAVVVAAPITKTIVPQMLAGGADPVAGWPLIAQMLDEVQRGDTTTLDALTGVVALGSTSDDPWVRAGKNGLFSGVLCSSFGPQDDYESLRAAGDAVALLAPRFAWKFWDGTPLAHGTAGTGDCAGWPLPASNPPHTLQISPNPNVLVANPTHDPATALSNALSVWLQIPQARLLLADVDGHQSLLLSQCAYETMASFLADPTSLASTTLCPA
jgi:pimeloyl-ACP methyl ester carboxylesterase